MSEKELQPKYYLMWKADQLGPGYNMRNFNKPEDVEDFLKSLHKPYDVKVIAGYQLDVTGGGS